MTFEKILDRIEELLQELESGNLGLEDSMKCYEEGIQLIHSCQDRLSQAEQKVYRLKETKETSKEYLADSEEDPSEKNKKDIQKKDFELFSA